VGVGFRVEVEVVECRVEGVGSGMQGSAPCAWGAVRPGVGRVPGVMCGV
jgi:hypothetical protein